jgi:subtilisin family serine protease
MAARGGIGGRIVGLCLAMAVGVVGLPAVAVAAEGEIRSTGAGQVVANSYVVRLRDDGAVDGKGAGMARDAVMARALGLGSRYGGKVGNVYTTAVRGFEISGLDRASARRLAADRSVRYVQENGVYKSAATQSDPPSWGLDRVDQRALPLDDSYTYPTVASNVHVYVIDGGIRFSHHDFGGRATTGFNPVDHGESPADDCQGHGTHVAGIIGGSSHGVAKGAQLVAVRVLDCAGMGTTDQGAAGVDWVTANAVKPAVANMSVVAAGIDSFLDDAVDASIASGVTYVVAAGNGDIDGNPQDACGFSPAHVPAAITVGATDIVDRRASFSNSGPCLDLFAPGVAITSTWITSDTATMTLDGTSMASPHVAGAAALVLAQNPGFSPQQVRDVLVARATAGVIGNPGTGSANRLVYAGPVDPPADDFSVSPAVSSATTVAGGSVNVSVHTATTDGEPQQVGLFASGLPSISGATFAPQSVTTGQPSLLTLRTSPSTPAGTYPVTIYAGGIESTSQAQFTLTVTGGSDDCIGSNGTNIALPDFPGFPFPPEPVLSPITVDTCNGNASAASAVQVDITHSNRGDLHIELLAPDGTSYQLFQSNFWDWGDDLHATFLVNLSSEQANGTWKLRVSDEVLGGDGDDGVLDSWTFTT